MDSRVESALRDAARGKRYHSGLRSLINDQIAPAEWYEILERYYQNNGLYDSLAQMLNVQGLWMQGMKPLRNPAHRAVEFHVSHLWPGSLPDAMPIQAKKRAVIDAIHQVWNWSNWGNEKQLAARKFANRGDLFLKVPTYRNASGIVTQTFLQMLDAANVIHFKKDARSFITYIRIDTHQLRSGEDGIEQVTRTEIWDKDTDTYTVYMHVKGKGAALKELGEPVEKKFILESFGFDFIPIVHAMFCDTGDERGSNCYEHALDKVDEANMQATRLHQMLFRYNKPTTVVMANAIDDSGRPLPPPTIEDRDGSSSSDLPVQIGDDDLWELPGYTKLEHLVPDLNYADALSILNAQMTELESDLPEILYYELKEKGELSGKALTTLLSGAVDRALEARGNAETALVRAQQMALTIAQIHGISGFEAETIGTFESGSFDHSFLPREVIPLSKQERAETVKTYVDSGMPLDFSMLQNGFNEQDVEEMKKSPEYKLRMEKLLMEAAAAAQTAGVSIETFLSRIGWSKAQLEEFGTQKLAAIKLQQEDTIPPTGQ
jgi:hypothetical protein